MHILERGNALFEALGTLFRRAGTDVSVLDIDLAFAPDHLSQRTRSYLAALDVVGADIRDGELHLAVDVVTVTQESIDSDDLDTGIDSVLQWGDHLFFVGRGDNQVGQVAARHH